MARPRVKSIGMRVSALDTRSVKLPPKRVDDHYNSPEHKAWREAVIRRAGGRCEWVDGGVRCAKAQPAHRMFADHIAEIRDGGDPFGPGRCLCGSHHTQKTNMERAKRNAQD